MEHVQSHENNQIEFDTDIIAIGEATKLTRGNWGYAHEFPDKEEPLKDQ